MSWYVFVFLRKWPTHLKQYMHIWWKGCHGECHASFWLSSRINKFARATSEVSVEMQYCIPCCSNVSLEFSSCFHFSLTVQHSLKTEFKRAVCYWFTSQIWPYKFKGSAELWFKKQCSRLQKCLKCTKREQSSLTVSLKAKYKILKHIKHIFRIKDLCFSHWD